jgi:hypothetical protein
VAVEAFFAALVDSLRSVPGLELVSADSDPEDEDSLPDFQIAIQGTGQDASGTFTVTMMGDPKDFLQMKRKLSSGGRSVGEGFGFASSLQGDLNPSCAPVVSYGIPDCKTPSTLAANLVDGLRKHTFPQDPVLKSRLKQDLLDVSLEPARRLKALTDLGSLKTSVPGEAFQDPSIVSGAISLARDASDPAIRAQVWRAMRGSHHPDMANAAIESLHQSSDEDARMQAVILLQEGFPNDPRARQALEEVSLVETRPLVRALALRAINGEAFWRNYVVSSLKDADRPGAERIEAFLYHMAKPGRTPGSIEFHARSGELSELLDDEAIGALTQLLPEAARSIEVKQVVVSILSALGAIQKSSVTSMFTGILEQGEKALQYPVVQELIRRKADPAARAALEKISREGPDAALREMAANALKASPLAN